MAEVINLNCKLQRLIHRNDGGRNFSRHNDPLKHWSVDCLTIMRDNRTDGPGMAEGRNHKQFESPCLGRIEQSIISTPPHVKCEIISTRRRAGNPGSISR